ncbi:hypothetical protein VP1G_00884 [Cytospora mali]|uniref:Ecp2 effector protein-like domain-containing protein n=1 Tax=Cytospora mali TaxID=578113 RepID=A0A194UPL7_CYTMA|nr:hypothetical protein VP1G_00884 [Valsa mali var. pyri (nom. inval.)]
MYFFAIIVMVANLACLAIAAIVPNYKNASHNLANKRTEVTFAWDGYPVQNCSIPSLGRSPPEHSILAKDCEWVLNMILSNNGGYFELWNFDSTKYQPIVGYQTCVLAVSHAVTHNSSDYAIVGNGDVATVMRIALANFKHSEHVATVTGNMTCGPNKATLGVLIYNGLAGDSGGPVNASSTTMMGDSWGGATGTGAAPALPSVTVPPSSSISSV